MIRQTIAATAFSFVMLMLGVATATAKTSSLYAPSNGSVTGSFIVPLDYVRGSKIVVRVYLLHYNSITCSAPVNAGFTQYRRGHAKKHSAGEYIVPKDGVDSVNFLSKTPQAEELHVKEYVLAGTEGPGFAGIAPSDMFQVAIYPSSFPSSRFPAGCPMGSVRHLGYEIRYRAHD